MIPGISEVKFCVIVSRWRRSFVFLALFDYKNHLIRSAVLRLCDQNGDKNDIVPVTGQQQMCLSNSFNSRTISEKYQRFKHQWF